MKRLKKITALFMAILLCIPFMNITTAKAAGTARVSIGSASGEVGDTVSVSVSIDASFQIGAATIYVSYDSSMLEPTSGSNTGTVTCNFLDSSASSSQSTSISFRIKAAGTSSLSVIGDSKVISMDYDNASISKSSGSITGNAPASYSSDNTLSSLQISPGVLSPAFSPNVTAYTTSVGSDCDRLTVSAQASDSKATVNISGTRMDPGMNTTTITVTAENGSKRTYTIKTTKADDIKSPEEASKEADSQINDGQGTDNNGNPEAVQEPTVGVEGSEYRIISSFEEHPLPAGFVQSETDYNGIKIAVGMGMNTRVMLAYLDNTDGTGESGFYVYDSVNKTFSKYIEVYQPELSYCVLPIDASSMELPDGYESGRVDINGQEVDALLDKTGNYALFYGVSSTGEAGWFRFNTNDGTIQSYSGYNTSDESVLISKKDKAAANQNEGIFNSGIFQGVSGAVLMIIAILVIIVIVLIIVVITLSRKLSVSKKAFVKAVDTDMDEYDGPDEDDELVDETEESDRDILADDVEDSDDTDNSVDTDDSADADDSNDVEDSNDADNSADTDDETTDMSDIDILDESEEIEGDILADEPEELALEEIELEETNQKDNRSNNHN